MCAEMPLAHMDEAVLYSIWINVKSLHSMTRSISTREEHKLVIITPFRKQ